MNVLSILTTNKVVLRYATNWSGATTSGELPFCHGGGQDSYTTTTVHLFLYCKRRLLLSGSVVHRRHACCGKRYSQKRFIKKNRSWLWR